jgi:hypothetical protein
MRRARLWLLATTVVVAASIGYVALIGRRDEALSIMRRHGAVNCTYYQMPESEAYVKCLCYLPGKSPKQTGLYLEFEQAGWVTESLTPRNISLSKPGENSAVWITLTENDRILVTADHPPTKTDGLLHLLRGG